jgi:hypothetical protein
LSWRWHFASEETLITIPIAMKVSQKKTLCLYLIIVIFAVMALECLSWLALKQVFLPRGYVYKPKLIQTLSSYAKYQAYERWSG